LDKDFDVNRKKVINIEKKRKKLFENLKRETDSYNAIGEKIAALAKELNKINAELSDLSYSLQKKCKHEKSVVVSYYVLRTVGTCRYFQGFCPICLLQERGFKKSGLEELGKVARKISFRLWKTKYQPLIPDDGDSY
jgi:hypothetical protein